MKYCVKCGNQFEQQTDKHRKHCYSCIPFGRTIKQDNRQGDLVCADCKRPYYFSRKGGCTRQRCAACQVNRHKKKRKAAAIEYKGGKCQLCGYVKCTRALVFHHIDDATKEFSIGGSHTRSWDSIKVELDQCALFCANCHAEVHEGLVSIS
jgi:hypothetical protein